MSRTVATTVGLCFCSVAIAEPAALTGKMLSEMIGGAVVEIDTPLGGKIPITYREDGRMSGQARGIGLFLGASSDRGRWWIAADMLCQKWETWFSGETQCMRIRKEGSRIHWVSRDGKTGTGSVQLKAIARPKAAPVPPVFAMASAAATTAPRAQRLPAPAALPEPVKLGGAMPVLEPAPASQPESVTTVATPAVVAAAPHATPQPMPRFSRPMIDVPAPVAEAHEPAGVVQATSPAPPPAQPTVQSAMTAAGPAATQFAATSEKPVAKTASAQVASMAAPAAAPSGPRFRIVKVAEHDVLNVRQGPSAEHGIVGSLPPSTRGIALKGECQTTWCPVVHGAVTGWVNRTYLAQEEALAARSALRGGVVVYQNLEAPRGCLTPAARALLGRIEAKFGPVQLVSTCRPGATISGTAKPSKHRDGNAFDFKVGARKQAVVDWLLANHTQGGTMTYRGMEHIHVDIGPHFVALASGRTGRELTAARGSSEASR